MPMLFFALLTSPSPNTEFRISSRTWVLLWVSVLSITLKITSYGWKISTSPSSQTPFSSDSTTVGWLGQPDTDLNLRLNLGVEI